MSPRWSLSGARFHVGGVAPDGKVSDPRGDVGRGVALTPHRKLPPPPLTPGTVRVCSPAEGQPKAETRGRGTGRGRGWAGCRHAPFSRLDPELRPLPPTNPVQVRCRSRRVEGWAPSPERRWRRRRGANGAGVGGGTGGDGDNP